MKPARLKPAGRAETNAVMCDSVYVKAKIIMKDGKRLILQVYDPHEKHGGNWFWTTESQVRR